MVGVLAALLVAGSRVGAASSMLGGPAQQARRAQQADMPPHRILDAPQLDVAPKGLPKGLVVLQQGGNREGEERWNMMASFFGTSVVVENSGRAGHQLGAAAALGGLMI